MTGRRPGIIVGILTALSLALRSVPQFRTVFDNSFVNFQETDAWFHVRVVENLVHHFPWRISVDPYLGPPPLQGVATGPFYDWLLAGIAIFAGLGHPSSHLLQAIAAWFPAVLGALIVPVVYFLGVRMIGRGAGLIAAAVVATLPGHFFEVSSLGFTDHHVMESLLSGAFILALLYAMDKPDSTARSFLSGVVLAAYLLTFVGGAFFVAIIVAWACFDRLRSVWWRPEPASPGRPLYLSFLIAVVVIAPAYRVLWMPFSIAALLAGLAILGLLHRLSARTALIAGIAAAGALLLAPGIRTALGGVLPFLFPAYFGATGAVGELQSLVLAPHGFSLVPAWRQFGGAYVLSIVALVLLGESTLRRPARGQSLLFFWGLSTFLLSMAQVRMTYYFALAAALLSGYVVARIFSREARRAVRWALGIAFFAGILIPNTASAIESAQYPRGVSADWQEALAWMRQTTPEPFGDPSFYYANYPRSFQAPPGAYSVMTWWDFGYWIETIARRVPVSNPTQANASLAAAFYLARTEDEAIAILRRTGARYVVVSAELPLLTPAEGVTSGDFPDFFVWDRSKDIDTYFLVTLERASDGKIRTKLLYRPAYYRSMAARLFVGGNSEFATPQDVSVAYFDMNTDAAGHKYRALSTLRHFDSYQEATAAEQACQAQGCALVGDNPQIPCVPLEALKHLREVFSSSTPVLQSRGAKRSAVQVYELLNP